MPLYNPRSRTWPQTRPLAQSHALALHLSAVPSENTSGSLEGFHSGTVDSRVPVGVLTNPFTLEIVTVTDSSSCRGHTIIQTANESIGTVIEIEHCRSAAERTQLSAVASSFQLHPTYPPRAWQAALAATQRFGLHVSLAASSLQPLRARGSGNRLDFNSYMLLASVDVPGTNSGRAGNSVPFGRAVAQITVSTKSCTNAYTAPFRFVRIRLGREELFDPKDKPFRHSKKHYGARSSGP